MKKNIFSLLILFTGGIVLLCCTQNNQDDMNKIVSQFSTLECRANSLRKQRYILADKIRFAEDSLIKMIPESAEKKTLQSTLNTLLKEKDNTLSFSLRLADTIKLQLDTIIKIRLKTRDKINIFDKALSLELQKRNCN